MVVLVTFKNDDEPVNNNGTRVASSFYIDFSDAQEQITCNSVVSGEVLPKFELIKYYT